MKTMLDQDAFGEAAEALSGPLYRFVVSRGAAAHEALDVVQETFLRAFRSRASLREPARFRGWIYEIARNVLTDSHRRPGARPLDESLPLASRPSVAPGAGDDALALRGAIEALPEDLREVLLLRYYDDLTYEEIADALAVPRPTVQGRLRRAKEVLRHRLRGAFADEGAAASAAVRAAFGAASVPADLAAGVRAAIGKVGGTASAGAGGSIAAASAIAAAALAAFVAVGSVRPAPPPPLPGGVAATSIAASEAPPPAEPRDAAREEAPQSSTAADEPTRPARAPAATHAAAARTGDPLDARALAAIAGEPEREPPPYPWRRAEPTRFEVRKMTVNFPGTPLQDALLFLNDIGCPTLIGDGELAEKVKEEEPNLTLRPKDVTVKSALELIAAQIGAEVVFDADGARLVTLLPPDVREARAFGELLKNGGTPYWRSLYTRALKERRVTLEMADGTLDGAVIQLQEASGLNFTLARDVDESLPISISLANATVGEALDALLRAADRSLRWELRSEGIYVTGEPEDRSPGLASRRVSLALVGATVPDLVHALEAQGVRVVVGPDTWASRGTLSVLAAGEPLEAVAKSIAARTSLAVEIVEYEQNPRREALLLRGVIPSIASRLVEPALGLPGVVTEWAELRGRAISALSERAEARRATPPDPERLGAAETEAVRAMSDLERFTRRVDEIARSRERVTRVAKLRFEADEDLAAVRRGASEAQELLASETDDESLARDRAIAAARAATQAAVVEERWKGLGEAAAAAARDTAILDRLERGERLAEGDR